MSFATVVRLLRNVWRAFSLRLHRTSMMPQWPGLLMILSLTLSCFAAETAVVSPDPISLSPAERLWVAAHPIIKVGTDPAWPPFSSASNGAVQGIDPDLLNLIGSRVGLRFEFVSSQTWSEIYAAAERREVDVLAGTARTAEREKAFQFTEPYFSFPVVIVTRNDEPILWSVLDLRGRRLIGVRGYVATAELARVYPQLEFLPDAESVEVAMAQVSNGEADAFVTNLPNASFTAKTLGLTNVKIAGVMPDRFNLCYAVRPDWPELTALLNRAIASLTEADRQAIVHPWIRIDYAKVIRWDLVWKAGLILLGVWGGIIGFVVYHNRRLGRELTERIRLQQEIKAAHDRLLQLNEDKTELMQMAAHDLRGPLTGIQLAVDASLRMNMVPSLDALQMVEKQVGQMTSLLTNLLDADALERGRREFEIGRFIPDVVVQSAVNALTSAADQKSIRIEVSIAEGLPEIEADATAFRQIADNLLSNAIKFSPRNSVVAVILEQKDIHVRLEVRDEGPGVAPEERERIFAKYARGSARPTGDERSTGLGLSIVRQLAAAMNGRVWCESSLGKGSSFILLVPVASAAVAADADIATPVR
jgi:signal transduction histidine kinase